MKGLETVEHPIGTAVIVAIVGLFSSIGGWVNTSSVPCNRVLQAISSLWVLPIIVRTGGNRSGGAGVDIR